MKMYECDICGAIVHINCRIELKTDADYLIWKFTTGENVIDVCTDCFRRIDEFIAEEKKNRKKGGK